MQTKMRASLSLFRRSRTATVWRVLVALVIVAFLLVLTASVAADREPGIGVFRLQQTEICDNGLDDDGDSLTDGFDPDCLSTAPLCVSPAFSGLSVAEEWASTETNLSPSLGPTVGDVDGDGVVEIIVPRNNSTGYRIYEGDGSNAGSTTTDVVITLGQTNSRPLSQPAIADVDGDGTAEIIAVRSNGFVYVFPHTGGD